MTFSQRTKRYFAQRLYDVLVTISVPFFLALIYFKGRRNPDYRRPLVQRLARKLDNYPINPIWFHAVSDGEFYAARRLIGQLLDAYPSTPVLITTTTPTGKDRVEAEFKELMNTRVWHAYLPFDQSSFTRRFLKKIQPIVGIFVETEIWPNFLASLNTANVPCALINARLSEKSFLGYQRFGIFAADTINRFDLIITQDEASASRFKKLLAPIESPKTDLKVSGNLKLDITEPEDLTEKTQQLRQQIGDTRFWVAASTHVGEDIVAIKAHKALSTQHSNLRLVIAPRHPERSEEIADLCRSEQLNVTKLSDLSIQAEKINNQVSDIIILDSIGQLIYFYALCDVAVIAGSFVTHGGHNPLEACLFKKPVITGPHYFNFQTMIDELRDVNGIALASEQTLAQTISALTKTPDPVASNGHAYLNANRGTTHRTFTWLQALIP